MISAEDTDGEHAANTGAALVISYSESGITSETFSLASKTDFATGALTLGGSLSIGTLLIASRGAIIAQNSVSVIFTQGIGVSYAAENSISLTNIDDVKSNTDLMNVIAGSWHVAS